MSYLGPVTKHVVPATPALELEAVQLKETLLEVTVPAARLVGTVGALVPEPDWLPLHNR